MSLPISAVAAAYSYLLQPVAPLAAVGLPVSWLDVVGTLRLALAVQQIKYSIRLRTVAAETDKTKQEAVMATGVGDSPIYDIWTMLTIVYGGEVFVSSFLGQPPSFFTSPVGPILLSLGHYAIFATLNFAPGLLPLIPSLKWELPLSFVDGFTRAILLCSIGPSVIYGHHSSAINDSATALVLSNSIMANGGFFIVNTFSMLSPFGWSVSTPPELTPYGWTSLDFLVAPLITSLYATLTQSQSTWKTATMTSASYLGLSGIYNVTVPIEEKQPAAGVGFDEEGARAICAIVLVALFSGRAVNNFGGIPALTRLFAPEKKLKTQ